MAVLAPSSFGLAPSTVQPLIWRFQAMLAAYLPLVLMAVLASGTWWLVKNTPLLEGPTEAIAPRHLPDYSMKNFDLQRIGVDGQLRIRIEGSELRHFPDTDTLEIDGVRLRAIAADGSQTLATAGRAISNGNASEIQLLGKVNLRRFDSKQQGAALSVPRLEVRGEFLQLLANTEQLRSHLPVTLIHAGSELYAQSFDYDHLRAQLSFNGPTSARFNSSAKR